MKMKRAVSLSRKDSSFTVDTSEDEIASALEQFRSTAQEIVRCRSIDRWSAPETAMLPDKQTCQDCDFRTSCPSLMSGTNLNAMNFSNTPAMIEGYQARMIPYFTCSEVCHSASTGLEPHL